MQKLLVILLISFCLSSCTFVHKMDVEQGNVLTADKVNKLHTGMTQTQVRNLLGTPILMNTFSKNRIDYVYTYKPGGGKMTEQYVTLIFDKKGVLREIKGNMYSEFIK